MTFSAQEIEILFGTAVVFYFVGAVLFLSNLFLKHSRLNTVAIGVSWIGMLAHTASIILRGAAHRMVLFSTPAEGWSLLAWAIAAMYLSLSLRPRLRALGAFALPAALIGSLIFAITSEDQGSPVLSNVPYWEWALHVPASILSLGAFLLAFACAVCYLIQDRLLKEKRAGGVLRALPPLSVLDTTSYWLVVLGFCLLTLGMASGAVLAEAAWKNAWLTHAKASTSLVLWLTCGVYLYARGIGRWRGRRTHRMVVVVVVLLVCLYGGAVLLEPRIG
jgi:ABC-type uncharacterized transport system permease subunit